MENRHVLKGIKNGEFKRISIKKVSMALEIV